MVDFTEVKRVGTNLYRYAWAAVNGPFRLYSNGQEVQAESPNANGGFDDTELTVRATDALEPPALEVLDSTETDDALNVQHAPRVVIQWRGDLGAERYRVEQFVGAAWVVLSTIRETGRGYYTLETGVLAAGAYQFRVRSVDPNGGVSDARTMDVNFAGLPEPPAIALSYDAGTGDLTIAAR